MVYQRLRTTHFVEVPWNKRLIHSLRTIVDLHEAHRSNQRPLNYFLGREEHETRALVHGKGRNGPWWGPRVAFFACLCFIINMLLYSGRTLEDRRRGAHGSNRSRYRSGTMRLLLLQQV